MDFGLLRAATEAWGFPGLLVAVLLLIVFLILRGKLWPKSMVDARLADKQGIIDQLQSTNEKYATTLEKVSETTEDLLEYAKTSDHLLKSIKSEGDRP